MSKTVAHAAIPQAAAVTTHPSTAAKTRGRSARRCKIAAAMDAPASTPIDFQLAASTQSEARLPGFEAAPSEKPAAPNSKSKPDEEIGANAGVETQHGVTLTGRIAACVSRSPRPAQKILQVR